MEFQIHSYGQLDSTNRLAWEWCEQGAAEGTVIVATQQTAGRGQWGRQWQSAIGGVYLSALLRPSLHSQDAGQLTICTAWGIASSLQAQGIPVRLKWPNDLVLQGRKLGGILTETRIAHNRIDRAVVGIGLNGYNPVPANGISLQSWSTQKSETQPDPTELLTDLSLWKTLAVTRDLSPVIQVILQGVNQGYCRWQQEGIEGILPDYEALLIHQGLAIAIEDQVVQIIGVTPQGRLKAKQIIPQGVEKVLELEPGQISLGYPEEDTREQLSTTA